MVKALELLAAELDRAAAIEASLRREYRNLLSLVAGIKAGEVCAADVEILPGDSWRLKVGKPEGEPCTPNAT